SVALGTASAQSPVINEFIANHIGSDSVEFIEVFGPPNTDLSHLTILQIEGNTASGTIDSVFPVGTTDAEGFWVTEFLNDEIENGTQTLLLVEGFSGALGDDIGANDDGIPDFTPWTRVVDSVGVTDGDAGDFNYLTQTILDNTLPGTAPSTPGGGSRIPNGVDTDTVADWLGNDFLGSGLAGSGDATLELHEARNTPGTRNFGRPDCNGNGQDDVQEILAGAADCNSDQYLDACQPDSDSDGTIDSCDECPGDPAKTDAGVCGCGSSDDDNDADGTPNCFDKCPDDPNKTDTGACGCGSADVDSDGDLILDCNDNCPAVPNADQADGNVNGVGDVCEPPPAGQQDNCGIPMCGMGGFGLMPWMIGGLWVMRRRVRRGRHGWRGPPSAHRP
ncbi:MAG: thrombospondin type 3 repeat-containing protein, partial [Planctomycetota bacterium]|nr:thrombospondin type 3 repeat-containing protein [Planctomycetota bacterium]